MAEKGGVLLLGVGLAAVLILAFRKRPPQQVAATLTGSPAIS